MRLRVCYRVKGQSPTSTSWTQLSEERCKCDEERGKIDYMRYRLLPRPFRRNMLRRVDPEFIILIPNMLGLPATSSCSRRPATAWMCGRNSFVARVLWAYTTFCGNEQMNIISQAEGSRRI
ncbi:uncharacterized protein ARMOST_20633 [Armillaria ostoyae]|uniref:Uncharacterized protein n=1 Tax=Armillaria ostoyae TaxID=47428 RepID=A0A284S7V4_ARMOS|nr:uncharacterized protein ARMOST_20633 [Armillaria ostoyae]